MYLSVYVTEILVDAQAAMSRWMVNMSTVEQPKPIPGSRLCLSVTPLGLSVYGNPTGLRALAKWLEWIASHSPAEHYECHVGMDIMDDQSTFENKTPLVFGLSLMKSSLESWPKENKWRSMANKLN